MSRPGPTPDPERRRVHRIGIYFSEDELDQLEDRLAVPGLASTVRSGGKNLRKGQKEASEKLRGLALGLRVKAVPVLNRQAYADLGRVGGNIRQIALSGLMNNAERSIVDSVLAELTEFREAVLAVKIQVPSLTDRASDPLSLDMREFSFLSEFDFK